MNPCLISVVIPTYQRCASVKRALKALAQQSFPCSAYEVIVSIDGSADGTQEMLRQLETPYALHAHWQANQGRAAACNQGIQSAMGELVILLDDDMEPAPEFLAAHWQAHQAEPRLGVIGAVPIRLHDSSPRVAQYIGTKFNQHLANLSRPDYQLKLSDFYSGNFSIRRAVLQEVGGFDETFRIYGNEDLELSLRLVSAAVRLVYSPAALAYQHYTKDLPALARDNLAKGRTAVLLASKHPEAFRQLKLNTYQQASLQWRILRGVLLKLSSLWSRAPDVVIRCFQTLDQRQITPLRWYYLLLDYCYWVGATAAMAENRRVSG